MHDHLDLDVRRGEVVGVIGGSGTGKSVLLRTVIGLKRPDHGQALLFGADLARLPEAQRKPFERRFGLLFQDGALFSSLTVAENIKVPLVEFFRLPPALLDEIVMLKLRLVGLPPDAAHKYPSQLSGGMKKRAGLARALALDPEVLFLDEPTANLDPGSTHAIERIVDTIHAAGTKIVMVTHNLGQARRLADEILFLHGGRLLERTAAEAFFRKPATAEAAAYLEGELPWRTSAA